MFTNKEDAIKASRKHFDSLDIFRGIFASMLVFFHLRTYTVSPILNNNIVSNSFLFVNFFFVLSGFVIAYNYQSTTSLNDVYKFIVKRFKRIYPLHFFLLLVFLFYFLAKKMAMEFLQIDFLFANDNWKTFLSSLFLIHSIRIDGFNESLSWNYPSWSISAEMIAYFIFSVSELIIYRIKAKSIRTYIIGFFLSFYIYSHYQSNVIYDTLISFDNGYLQGLAGFYFGVFGVIVYKSIQKHVKNISNSAISFLELCLTIGVLISIYNGSYLLEKFGLWLFSLIFLAVIVIFSLQKGFLSISVNKSNLLKSLGLYSYSIYMNHVIIILIFNFVLTRLLHLSTSYYNILFILVYVIVFKMSELTYRYIEVRFNR